VPPIPVLKNGDLLLGGEALSGFLGHGGTSTRSCR
jgi:hypothetical protein